MRARGINSQQCAKERLKVLGRNGRLPWCEEDVMRALPYLAIKDLVIIPTAHALLRGLLKSLLDYSLKTQVSTVPKNHPVVFNSEQRRNAMVRASCIT
jgi:hypothetical protein